MKRGRPNPVSRQRRDELGLRVLNMLATFGPEEERQCQFSTFLGRAVMDGLEVDSWKLAPCYGPVHGHEILKRSRGGSITDMENVVLLCNFHNGWIEDFPKESHALGLSRHAWEVSTTKENL